MLVVRAHIFKYLHFCRVPTLLFVGAVMPKREYTCGLDAAIAVMGGKWKGLILFNLGEGPLRFGELRRAVAGISERVLILQLREMEASGLLHREVHHQVPPKVEYSLTPFGRSLNTALAPLGAWGEEHMDRITALP
jgi:DNA-binding HxlR family transcriptional regulator